jgi:LytS/YehU family sensor histidine kinase
MTETTYEIPRKFLRITLVAAASIGALLVWAVAALLQIDVTVYMNGTVQAVGGASIAVSAALGGFGGWAVKALLERMLRRPKPVWLTISIVVALLSMFGPLTMATSVAASVVLVLTHLVPAAILIPGLARTSRRRTRTGHLTRPEASNTVNAEAVSTGSGYGGAP